MMLPNCELVNVFGTQYLVFKGNDLISNALKQGGYEIEVFAIAQKILQKHKDGIVLDIGANLGSFTLPLAKANSHLTFHSFEPQRIIYYQLCANTLINGLNKVYCHNFGLSDKQDRFEVVVPDYANETNIGAFSIDKQVRETEYECPTQGATETMVVFPLDDGQHANVRLIKIDVEGHELEVLKGAKKTLKDNNYPPIIFEAWTWKPWYQEKRKKLFDYLTNIGYKITEGVNSNNLAQHPDHGEMLK
jgi:FkbM family methyltransferase